MISGPNGMRPDDLPLNDTAPNRVDPSSTSAPVPSSGKPLDKSVGGTIAAAAVSGIISGLLAIYQNKTNKENYEQQVKDNIAQWERENAYNSPSAQMSRFRAAGLNPDLIYGQSNTSGSTQVAPQMAESPNYAGILSSVNQMRLQTERSEAEIDLLRSQAEKNRSDVEHNSADIEQKWKELELQDKSLAETMRRNGVLDKLDEARQKQILDAILSQQEERKKITQDIQESISRVGVNKALEALHQAQRGLVDKQSEWYGKTAQAQINLWQSQGLLNKTQAEKLQKEIDHYESRFTAELQEIIARTGYYNASANHERAQANSVPVLTEARRKEVEALVEKYQSEMTRYVMQEFFTDKFENGAVWEKPGAYALLTGSWLLNSMGSIFH